MRPIDAQKITVVMRQKNTKREQIRVVSKVLNIDQRRAGHIVDIFRETLARGVPEAFYNNLLVTDVDDILNTVPRRRTLCKVPPPCPSNYIYRTRKATGYSCCAKRPAKTTSIDVGGKRYKVYTGKQGGKYYVTASGRKRYIK